jgi:hypothetical protein
LRLGALAVLLLALAGCSPNDTFTRMGFPNPVTEQGKITLSLWQGSWIAGLLVGAVVWGMIVWAVIFHRKRGDKLPPQVRYNMPIEILYTVVPFVLIAVLFYYTAKDENTIDAIPAHPQVTVNVTGLHRPQGHRLPVPDHLVRVLRLRRPARAADPHRSWPGRACPVSPEQYNQLFTMHGTIMLLMFATPLFAASRTRSCRCRSARPTWRSRG